MGGERLKMRRLWRYAISELWDRGLSHVRSRISIPSFCLVAVDEAAVGIAAGMHGIMFYVR